MPDARGLRVVGHSVDKLDALALATGGEKFAGDDLPQGTLYARILTSPWAHARILRIDAGAARQMKGVRAVITWEDVPRVAHTTAGQGFPEPSPYDSFTLDNKVRFVGDRVAAVAADSPAIARAACEAIEVEYEQLAPIFDPRDSMKEGAPVIHDEPEARMIVPAAYDKSHNMAAQVTANVGDVEAGLAGADVVVEREFEVHRAQHCHIEPHVALAYVDGRGRLVIRTSTQVPFHVRRIVAERLQWPIGKVRVIKPRIGGGFGGKQEVLVEDIPAVLAIRTGKPVLLEYTRAEEFVSARTRHPQILKVRAGAKKDGSLTAYDLDILMDTGAYGSHALTVVCNSGSKTLPLYRWQNIRFRGTSVYTNLPVGGAYRGYGATQAYFPLEVLMDELAEKVGMDALEIRRRNHIRSGEGSPIFQALGEGSEGVAQTIGSCGLAECIELGAEAIDWKEMRGKAALQNGPIRRGVGMCCLMQGSSIPRVDMGAAYLKMGEDGTFNLLMGATDLGTGSDTVLAQVAAEVLGIPVSMMTVYSSDTDLTPFDVGAYASSTTYLSGEAVAKAARQAREMVLEVASEILGCPVEEIELADAHAVARDGRKVHFAQIGRHALYVKNQRQVQGAASHITRKSPPPFSAQFAEVEVDTETGQVRVLKYVAAVDCGTAINPKLAEGQIEGAVLNGISYALAEEYIFDPRGRMLNNNLNYYKIFGAADLPDIRTILVPTWEPTGPFGAKSVSEIGINGPIPAIANAIYDAVGIRLLKTPFTPESVLRALGRL
ncbi:MAG: aldehyde oxidase [Deltaproteobacteria bacterium]|nr:aldehyde oxidase [Deltaproteobacteria bacterium]